MDKSQVADILDEIATLLELKGENAFKTRAYRAAARTVEALPEDLGRLVAEDRLAGIPGIGDALRQKITELVATGRLLYHGELKAAFPPGVFELLQIPGLGPKKVKALLDQLGVSDLAALEQACHDHRVAALAGFGAKTEANLLLGIAQRRAYRSQHRYGDVFGLAEGLVEELRSHPAVLRASVAGSLRRGKEVLTDLDLLASSSQPQAVMDFFVRLPGVERVTNHGETKSSVLFGGGLQCDLRVVGDREYPYALHHFTGSKEHNVALRQRAIAQGKKLSEWGLFAEEERPGAKDEKAVEILVPCRTEEEIFRNLGLQYIPPELRENLGEIEAAEAGRIPRLVDWRELRGTFHCHTDASDGKNTLAEMADAAAELGLDYLGIADHSKSSFQANGLDETRFLAQQEAIRAFNRTCSDIRLFAGVECDILKDGKLDFADDFLATFDYVVASVHAGFAASEEEMTRRIVRAMENPCVTMLGHATGRLLLKREAYAVNLNKILDCAAETGTWIELNANPFRLDLDWRWWKKARDQGVRCVLNPDAHGVADFGYLRIGAQIARKGWLRREDVVNTRPLAEMEKLLRAQRARRPPGLLPAPSDNPSPRA